MKIGSSGSTFVQFNWNSQISAHVSERLAELLESRQTDSPCETADLARRIQALPVYTDMSGALAFTVDGRVLFFSWETEQIQPTNDEWVTVAAVAAAEKYPELREILPQRPATAATCGKCGGTGKLQLTPELTPRCYTCRGLGWVETA